MVQDGSTCFREEDDEDDENDEGDEDDEDEDEDDDRSLRLASRTVLSSLTEIPTFAQDCSTCASSHASVGIQARPINQCQ